MVVKSYCGTLDQIKQQMNEDGIDWRNNPDIATMEACEASYHRMERKRIRKEKLNKARIRSKRSHE